jgi:hypothetical protein
LRNEALLPSRRVLTLVYHPANHLGTLDYFVQDVGTFNTASDALNTVMRERLPKVRKKVEFRL